MLKSWFTSALICLMATSAAAAGVDLAADTISRDASGAIVAEGNVTVKREGETLVADEVSYDAAKQQIEATGNIHIESKDATIRAKSARMQTVDKSGVLEEADVTLKQGERLSADRIVRHSQTRYSAEDATFTTCPEDEETWNIHAQKVELDQEEGVLTATNTTFRVADIPLFYTPYWRQTLRRKSGLLMPYFSSGRTRGTEWALPLYLAPADNWDATLTPHYMTARGMMGKAEVRHVSSTGAETIRVEGLKDKVTSTQRSRLRGDIQWALPYDMFFSASADHVSDRFYLTDFAIDGNNISSTYLQSDARLSQYFEHGEWALSARHQQNLALPSNASTLQIVPRLESDLYLPVANDKIILHLNQESTQFARKVGVDGWRVDLNPYIEIPWQLSSGGIQSTLKLGSRHTRYWLRDLPGQRILKRNTFEASLDNRISFERISSDRRWRHSITPILRYDYTTAPDQSNLPNFDSSFGKLSMSNLLNGNRFTGRDRIERLSRISLMLETELQHKRSEDSAAKSRLQAAVGVAYDLKRESVDPLLLPAPTRPFSNLLGNITLRPIDEVTINANGQYDPVGKFWATASSSIGIRVPSSYSLRIGWRRTDARYARAAELITANTSIDVTSRWNLFAHMQYDR
ncbi:MAG TPA: LPS assembly protein LptD, partial [Mariprofundaceae bacterium]|nr:LPS assembly protein LptD [Mariprofundaceae bacterium]